jgi:putative multicomponent Na+:H+ antiporter subunit B
MNNDLYLYLIIVLLPLSSILFILEKNPYNALVIRGILGAVAVLIYLTLGAADVALTEALVGTMLAVTLYIIAVRSSLVMRLGIVKNSVAEKDEDFELLTQNIKEAISQHYLRLELVSFDDQEALKTAFNNQEIHGICLANQSLNDQENKYELKIRIKKLNELITSKIANGIEKITIHS